MSTPQNPRRRQWQKKRRTRKLADWRAKKAQATQTSTQQASSQA
jgi:hypothetical protein